MNTKTYKQTFIVLAVSIFIVPQIALATWWNPLSWSIWNIFKPTPHAQVQIATTTTPTALAITTEKADTKVVSPKKSVADSTQKVSQPNIKQPSVTVPSQSIPTPAPSCTQDTWNCSDWLTCSSSGSQTRSCSKTLECPSVVTPSPITSQSCTPPAPSCQTDTWSCGDWNTCSASGNQTRDCTKTFDCSVVNTPSPSTSQSCTPPLSNVPKTPKELMPGKPTIESLCDDRGNCAHSQFADLNQSSRQGSFPTIKVGETLNFNVKVSGLETENIYADFLPYSGIGSQSWSQNLTYSKTFTNQDINTSQFYVNVYIKSQNDDYHRLSSCKDGPCDDYAGISYIVIP